MPRTIRTFVPAGLLLALAAFVAAQPPNIVIVLLDDMGYSDLGCYGGEARTPNIDRLAADGIRFRSFYNTSRCAPTRASLLTGAYSHQVTDDPADPLPNLRTDNNATLPELLRGQGYRTYMAGKWHLGFDAGRNPWERGFQHAFVVSGSYWNLDSSQFRSENNEISRRSYGSQAYDYYQTDACADYGIDFLNHHLGKNDGEPLFLYMAFNAPHFAIAADKAVADPYLETYAQGWNTIRQARFDRMKAMGVLGAQTVLPEFSATPFNAGGNFWPVPEWSTLAADRRADLTRRMALYAAMIDRVDVAVGRIVTRLDQAGQLENTLILVMSDNGANAEGGLYGRAFGQANHPPLTGTQLENMGQPNADDGIYLGGGWANAANTPFRLYKRFSHEGGIRTPLIIHWPDGIASPGRWSDQVGHVMDVVPTLADMLDLSPAVAQGGSEIAPWEGTSLWPVLKNEPLFPRQIGFEHLSTRAWIDGDWKLATKNFSDPDLGSFADTLELYNLAEDPVELHNVAMAHPERLVAMINDWNAWAQRVGVPTDRILPLPALDKPATSSETDLLLDTFNRNDTINLNAATNGLGGRLAEDVLRAGGSVYFDSGSLEGIRIYNGALHMADGSGTSEIGLDINFVDASILETGGFSVEMDINGFHGSAVEAAGTVAVANARPTENILLDIDVNDNVRGIIRVNDAGTEATDRRAIGQTFQLGGASSVAEVSSVSIKLGRDLVFGAGRHDMQIAFLEDTTGTGIGDWPTGSVHTFDLANLSASKDAYLTFHLPVPAMLKVGATYSIELWFANADPTHTQANLVEAGYAAANFQIYRGSPATYASGTYIEGAAPTIATDFPFGDAMSAGNFDMNIVLQGATTTPYAGFGVGLSQSEAAAGDGQGSPQGFRNHSADFFVELDQDGNIHIRKNGELQNTIPVGPAHGRLAAVFSVAGFAEDQPARADVYFNGSMVDSRPFAWEHDGQNHIGLGARSGGWIELDNFAVRTGSIGLLLASGYARDAGLSGADADPHADPDGDGRSNLLEWIIGTHPAVADADVRTLTLRSVPVGGANPRIRFRQVVDEAGNLGFAGRAYVSSNLVDWTSSEWTETGRTPVPEQPGYEEVELELAGDHADRDRLFVLVRYE